MMADRETSTPEPSGPLAAARELLAEYDRAVRDLMKPGMAPVDIPVMEWAQPAVRFMADIRPILATQSTPEPSGLREKVEALRIKGADYATKYAHGYNDALRAVLGLLDAAPSTEPALDVERCAECSGTIKHSFTCPRVIREVNRLREAARLAESQP